MIPAIATGLTLAKNFGVHFGIVAVVASMLTVGPVACVTKRVTEGRALKAEAALERYRAEMATAAAAAAETARQREREAAQQLRDQDAAVVSALNAIPGQITTIMQPVRAELRRLINDPTYDCLRTVPLPGDYLERLRIPESDPGGGPG